MKVVQNTYPKHTNVPHAEIDDVVHWAKTRKSCYELIRDVDGKTVFVTAPVDRNGKLRSNGKQPRLTGMIASVKSKGWWLVIG